MNFNIILRNSCIEGVNLSIEHPLQNNQFFASKSSNIPPIIKKRNKNVKIFKQQGVLSILLMVFLCFRPSLSRFRVSCRMSHHWWSFNKRYLFVANIPKRDYDLFLFSSLAPPQACESAVNLRPESASLRKRIR